MQAFLASLDYNGWILPALLIIPTLGALVVWVHGAVAGQGEAAAMTARRLTLAILVLEFVLSIGLWFSDRQDEGLFVGLWVPSILALGAFVMASFPSAGEN